MLQLSALHKAFGARVLFDDATWQVRAGDRIGLCGPNGAGKTTLLRMLAGLDEPDGGAITHPADLTVGYLPQDGLTHAGHTLFAEARNAFGYLLSLQSEMRQLEIQLSDAHLPATDHERMLTRYSEIQDTFRNQGGYDIESRVTAVLRGLGFNDSDFDRQTDTFSGGWQMRIALAALLLRRPRLLLMDEPTNHLDLEARNWLEEFLIAYPHAVVLVSHDRFFLDSVVTAITEIALRTLSTYPGSYSAYVVEHDAQLEKLREQKRRQDEEVVKIQAFIDRFRYKATKAAQVQSRVKMLAKITPIEVPPDSETWSTSRFRLRPRVGEPSSIFATHGRRTARSPSSTTSAYMSSVATASRWWVPMAPASPRSCGCWRRWEPPDRGTRIEGPNVVAQYFAQDEAARLDGALTVYETLASGSPIHMVPSIRNILGGFLFEGNDIYKRVRVLSGGERTRLAVARMLLCPSNTLLLDEPTNHLDIDSTNVLLDALVDYGGTLIFVSHDRYFVDRLATKVLEIGHGSAVMYPGNYEEFRWSVEQRARHASASAASPPRPQEKKPLPPGEAAQHRRTQGDVRRRQRRLRTLHARIADLEQRIGEREAEIRGLETTMGGPAFYGDGRAAKTMIDRHQRLMWEVGDLMNQWEALQNEATDLAKIVQKS